MKDRLLKDRVRRAMQAQEGFTLIELVVVVALIGILAWLITPRLLGTLDKSRFTSAEAAANEIYSALERYAAENDGEYPETLGSDFIGAAEGLDLKFSKADRYMKTDTWTYEASDDKTAFCATIETKGKEDGEKDGNTYLIITENGVESSADGTCSTPATES